MTRQRPTFPRPENCTGKQQRGLVFRSLRLALPLWLSAFPAPAEARSLASSGREQRQEMEQQGKRKKPSSFLEGPGLAVLQARWPELDTEIIRPKNALPVPKAVVDAAAVADDLARRISKGPQPSDADRVRSAVEGSHASPGGQSIGGGMAGAGMGFMSGAKAQYTTNFLCLPRHCINPIFPAVRLNGINVFTNNEKKKWKCVENHQEAWKGAGFCGQIVAGYHFAIPEPVENQSDRVIDQEHHAINAYVAHMAGIGHDFWDYTQPWNHDECVQNIWKLACYTYFPRCNALQPEAYLRPCASSCQAYVDKCKVECCDEGTQCTFQHDTVLANGSVEVETGYVPHSGPSPLCTGSSLRSTAPLLCSVIPGVLLVLAAVFS